MDASFIAAKATLRRMRHGLERMGDYVSKRTNMNENLTLPLAAGYEEEPCRFVVDGQLLDAYPKEIREISEI